LAQDAELAEVPVDHSMHVSRVGLIC
jgi:hypothetical protein